MERQKVISRLKELGKVRGTFKAVEVALKMPENCLSNYASEKKDLPDKWVEPLSNYIENLARKRLVLISIGNGEWQTEDGRKCHLIWSDLKPTIDTLPEVSQQVKEFFTEGKEPVRYNFGNAKFLIIENFTEYPLKDKPANRFKAAEWLKEKAAADAKIKEAWAKWHP